MLRIAHPGGHIDQPANADEGVNVTKFDDVFIVAAIILFDASFNWKVVEVTVDGLTDSLKLAVIAAPVLTPMAALAGKTDTTVGGTTSMAPEKHQTATTKTLPTMS